MAWQGQEEPSRRFVGVLTSTGLLHALSHNFRDSFHVRTGGASRLGDSRFPYYYRLLDTFSCLRLPTPVDRYAIHFYE